MSYESTFRTSPRTKGCKDYSKEKLPRPPPSNFISHLSACKHVPPDSTFEEWEARKQGKPGTSNGDTMSVSGGVATARIGGRVGQVAMMKEFQHRAAENPEKEVTKKGFREHFVKGVIEDDLPYTFGERRGMSRCFTYILPKGYKVPDRKAVRRDLDVLHYEINQKINDRLQV